ncbi:MAG: glycosyltransferase family A protein, partial [Candidatus Tectomicrobia bacterium]
MPEAAIGVVIPAYNAGRFLSEAIESVRSQSLANWECVIVDDGSTDGTEDLLPKYKDPRIQSLRQENLGERAARLNGFQLTEAAKIVFLDADDRLFPDTLARYSDFLDSHPRADVVYGERTLITEDGQTLGPRRGAYLNKHPKGDVLQPILRRPFISTPAQACLRRTAVPPAESQSGRCRMGDWLLMAAAALDSRFAYLGKSPVVEYRVHAGSQHRSFASNGKKEADPREFDDFLDQLFAFPSLEERFGVTNLPQLRRATQASCLAMKGQEFLRHREYLTA